MIFVPYFVWASIITVLALLTFPDSFIVSLSLRFIALNNPISVIKGLIQSSSSQGSTHYNQNMNIKSNYPTASDAVFGEQKPVWTPVAIDVNGNGKIKDNGNGNIKDNGSINGNDNINININVNDNDSDNVNDNDNVNDKRNNDNNGNHGNNGNHDNKNHHGNHNDDSNKNYGNFDSDTSFPYLECFKTLLESIRFLAYNAWHDPRIFTQPEAVLVPKDENNESAAKTEEAENVAKICEILLLSGIEYNACDSLVDEKVTNVEISPWSEPDEYGIKWKEAGQGDTQGCQFFLRASSVPLKMSTTTQEDGTTKLSYYTKNTIGKYCPDGDTDEEAQKFFKELAGELRPSKLSVFLNTRLFYSYTVFDMLEFHLLMDACLIAVYRYFIQNDLGQPSNWALLGFITTYAVCYSIYYWVFK